MKIFRLDMSASDPEACYPLLNGEERLRAEALGANRRRFIISRAFRRQVLGGDAEILTEPKGRPFVKGNPIFFSMSHSGDIVVMAVDRHPVGIDLELMKERDFARLSSRFFGQSIPDGHGFYKRWTRYEAGLKLAGLPLFSKAAPEPEYVHSEAWENHMLSIASNSGIGLPLSVTAVQLGYLM